MQGAESRQIGRLLPKSEWGTGKPVEPTTTAPVTGTADKTVAAEESTETRTTSITINHGFVVDSIIINGSRCGSSQGGNEASFELEVDEEILYVAAKRVRNDFSNIFAGEADAKVNRPNIIGARISLSE